MFQPKLRRVLVSATLVSALSLLPAHAAAPRPQRPQQTGSERNVAVRLMVPVWDLVTRLLGKSGIRIDPDGHVESVQVESNDDVRPSGVH